MHIVYFADLADCWLLFDNDPCYVDNIPLSTLEVYLVDIYVGHQSLDQSFQQV